ncbi:carboxypeptidase S3, penicillopeptidase S3, CPD-S3 [Polychaeton citri CBS 116435]|uniref:Carboxypeptidase n=1 Tax=Polychaeton citri CBS 116435 TaxID=1314669 RepID=A0A9P4UTT5_9PEZI|nr:carboxypeptidase S3, penicillopeptidase S3, CPD-S3 [Polychaeton citri CBS 116435]
MPMPMTSRFVSLTLACSLLSEVITGTFAGREAFHAGHRPLLTHHHGKGADQSRPARNESSFRFLSNDTRPYVVNSLPEVPYDIGEMYSGLIPIDYSNTSEALFFIFQPTIGIPCDELTIFLNGGPGWSSFESFFQETGRFTWVPGTFRPVENPYSWVNETNMLWVDQPIGTGFSIGTPKATTEEETAQDFIKFFKNFETLFGIKSYRIYVTGESYAGRYVPYIASAMLDENDSEYYDVTGALIYDPCIGNWDFTQQEVPVVPFTLANNNVMGYNATFIAQLEQLHESCGYADWLDTYLTFPPPGIQPSIFFNSSSPENKSCAVWEMIDHAAFSINPCFNVYAVNDACPLLWDVLAHRTQFDYIPEGATVYPNRTDVKAAMHAPDITWYLDQNHVPVYVAGKGSGGPEMAGDTSLDPIQYVLPKVIEATNRVLISNGDLDMIIITNGTLLAIQNMTWNGKLGFQSAPTDLMVVDIPDLEYRAEFDASGQKGRDGPQGVVGTKHYERGLMWTQTYLGSHVQPESQPRAAYRHLQWLLGRIDDL